MPDISSASVLVRKDIESFRYACTMVLLWKIERLWEY